MKDLYNNIALVKVFKPDSRTDGGSASVEVDLAGANSAVIGWYIGDLATSTTSNYWAIKLEHADDSATPGTAGDYAAVTVADVLGTATVTSGVLDDSKATDDAVWANTIHKFGYVGGKRHIKISLNETGTGPTTEQALFVIKGHLLDAPPIA